MKDRTPVTYRGFPAILITFCLLSAGCGGDDAGSTTAAETVTTAAATTITEPAPTTTAAATTTSTTTPPATTEPAPESFTMGIAIAPGTSEAAQTATAAGAERATADFGVEVTYSWTEGPAIALRELAETNDLVLAVGFGFDDAIAEVAGGYPDVVFVRVDGTVAGPNVVSTRIATNEAAFLVGAAAALTSQTGRVGFIGGVQMPAVATLEAGFTAGAAVDPEVIVSARYLGEPGEWEAFNNPELARTAALEMYGDGIDVIFHGAGGSGAGVFAAAAERRAAGDPVWAIGADFDQAAGADPEIAAVILTSAIRTFDGIVYWAVEQFAAGTLTGGEVDLGIAEGAVSYATTGGFLGAIVADLENLAAAVADGSIVVPEQ